MKGKAMARFSRQTRRNDSKIAGMYDLEERLGAGHFAEVKLARHVFTGERVAVKVIDKLKLDETAKHHLYQEVRCMKLVQHPNIVRLYEVIDTNTKLYLVQELGDGGDMYDYIMKHERGLSEEKARRYFRQILQAIDYCHKLYVVHRDLKPENVIFFKKFDVAKLTDFGFSNKFLPGKKLETACGSLAYSAPEILLGDSYDAPAVDVWSLGVILYMMVVGKAPFYEANESETLTMILDCKFEIPDYVSTSCKSLISRMIVRDASQRATLVDIMSDPWVLEGYGPINVTTVPLANQISLGVDQHNEVVQKMQLGAIADKETIKKCLESGSYNHVSATYYLLAEQVLRRLRWHRNLSSSSLSSQGVENKTSGPKSELSVSVEQASSDKNGNSAADRPVDDTSVEDISVEDSVDGEEPDMGDIDANLVTNRLTYHSTESIYDQVNSGADKQHDEEEMVGTVSVSMTKKQRKVFQKRRVAKVKSTPAFLNQISEERESDLDDSPRASPRVRRLSRRPVDVLKAQQKNRRPSPASSSGGRRSSSVSSSSEDDGDLDKKMRRLSTERCRRSPKRRSDDEGDGDDGEGGVGGSRGVAKKKMLSESSQTGAAEQTNTETGSNSDVQGKCANACLLFDKFRNEPGIVRVNSNETHKCDSQKNEVGGNHMDTTDVSWNVLDCSRWHLEKAESSKNDNLLREDKQPVRACVDNDCFNGGLKDRTVEECIVQDGILVRGIINDEITENESVKEGTRNSGNVGTKKKRIADILGHRFAKGDFVEDGIVKNGFLENDIRKDRFADNSVSKDGNVKGVVLEDKIVKVRFLEGGVKENEHAEDGIMDIFDETEFTSNKCHKIASSKENLNFSSNTARALIDFKEHDNYANDGIIMDVFRLADVDGTSKETSLEMRSPAFRTLFNNPKVAQVTSNCCRIL